MPIVVNAINTRLLSQIFFPSLPFAPFFSTLAFLNMFWVHVVLVLGMLGVLGSIQHATRPLAHVT